MISCTEFIPAYNEFFKYLHRSGGKQEVEKFWKAISDAFLGNLRDLAARKGLQGCFEYWSKTLREEAADFRMVLNRQENCFTIEMRHCPSMGRLLREKKLQPYPYYCEHCDILYRRVLEPLGFSYEIDLSNCLKAACRIVIRKNP